mmetsp:Transcript_32578/g.60868  ORF Transcript_32578/g.60868 Transcript_32578/m.60868 type:complete len:302 (+) Transcript_32578:230-1135(+)
MLDAEPASTKNPDHIFITHNHIDHLAGLPFTTMFRQGEVPVAKVSQDSSKDVVAVELALSTEAIKKNSKSYGAWYHRVWIVDRFEVNVNAELALCTEFLTYDQRNFHCWNYRRYLVSMASSVTHASEFQFSTDKISENFSNYSAFHHRSVYIESLVSAADTVEKNQENNQSLFEEEFSIIENAVFTEPDDQSAWWYYHFLLKFAVKNLSLESTWFEGELRRQLETLDSLLEVEPSSKWCMLAKMFLITTLLEVAEGMSGEGAGGRSDLLAVRQAVAEGLCVLDPAHVNRYRYMLNGFNTTS